MEAAIQTLVKVFLQSSKKKESLGKKEFQSLVKSQLSNIMSGADSKEAVSNMGQELDANQDGKVGFDEYMKLIGYLAVSYSEQHVLNNENCAQNAASGQVAQSAPDKEEEKPEANAEAKEEAKPEANEEPKAESSAEVKVEANADAKADIKEEGETQPDVAKEEPAAAPAVEVTAAATEVAAVTVEVATKEKEVVEITEKVEEAAEKVAAAVEEEVEKKTEEATS
ncbi:S100 calcium binding protein U [Solea solea]|uniref:S100 calcium binding protein U n=1 Tax=Solea solea TaxID=90069 RepID=UPI00272ADBCD|nr:S100 calcium binding protein U [Solea solea]